MIEELISFLQRDPITIILAVATALTAGVALFAAQWFTTRSEVKRRAARAAVDAQATHSGKADGQPEPQSNSRQVVERITASVDKLFGEGDQAAQKVLRQKLVQAGYYGASAPAIYLTLRVAALVGLGCAGFMWGMLANNHATDLYMKLVAGAGLGYFAPSILLDQMIGKRKEEHRLGFPDFLDLMIVCCEAGLSMEASINRVCREMAVAYPSLSANLYFATLEVRAGRTVNDALSNLSGRLGIQEARTFATLLQQSAELGSSLVDSLKVYSDDMRNKRMMRAEEKANALPSKMTIPLMIFIFPIIFIILLFPAYMRVKDMWTI